MNQMPQMPGLGCLLAGSTLAAQPALTI